MPQCCVDSSLVHDGHAADTVSLIMHNEHSAAFDYFVITTLTRPSRLRMLIPTSVA